MKTLILSTFFLLFSITGLNAQAEPIIWEKDFKSAQKMARETGRPLLLDFTAPWCKPCLAMDKEFWVREDVVKSVKPFIAVKIDFDNERNLVGRYGVSAIPFVIFADPLGNLITFRRGFSAKNVKELFMIFDEMPTDFSPMKKYYDALDLKKDDGLALFQIANAYRGAKMLSLSNEFYRKALKTSEIQADNEKRTNAYLSLGVNYLNTKMYEQAVEVMEDFLKTNPTGEVKDTVLYFLVLGNANNDKAKNAEKYLKMLKTEFQNSKNIANAETAVEAMKNRKK